MKLIGKGTFSKVYQETDTTVIIKTCDPCKEVLAHGWVPDEMGRFPVLEVIEQGVYRCKLYAKAKLSSLSKHDRKLYNVLRSIFNGGVESHDWPRRDADLYFFWRDRFVQAKATHADLADEFDALLEALDGMTNIGSDVSFEISPRNIAIENGKLIYLDVFYSHKMLHKVRTAQVAKHSTSAAAMMRALA